MKINDLPRLLKENDADFILLSIVRSGPRQGWYFCNINNSRSRYWCSSGTGPDPENAVLDALRKWEARDDEPLSVSVTPSLNLNIEDL